MKMVVLNAGSGSQKCSLFELPVGPLCDEPLDPIWEAKLDSTAPDQSKGKLVTRISRHGEDILRRLNLDSEVELQYRLISCGIFY